jgi:hypothetical protein
MANYSVTQMTAGVLGEVLTGGTSYTFTIATPAYTSQSVYFGAATLTLDSSTVTNSNLQGSSTNQIVGSLNIGQQIPLSNTPISCDVNQTATIFVNGLTRGSGAQLSFTSTGWNGVLGSGTGKITEAFVVSTSGSNYISGDDLNVPRGTPGIQGLGFTNADKAAIMDIFPDKITGTYISSDFTGTYANFTTDVSQSNFVSSSDGFSFGIKQAVGTGAGTFDFTPTTTIPVSSYLIKSTGNITLNISPA